MKAYPHPLIAREGWLYLALAVLVSAVLTYFYGWWSLPAWVVTLFVLQFFRDPSRDIPQDRGAVLAAADGRVVSVGRTRDPYLERDALKISVFMNVFNAHSNRSPVDGVIREQWYHAGRFFNASLDKACLENERNALWIRTDDGQDVTCVQVAGLVARRILCYCGRGDRLKRGQRFGFIRFGSRVDIYLPPGSQARVGIGDKVYASRTVLAHLMANP